MADITYNNPIDPHSTSLQKKIAEVSRDGSAKTRVACRDKITDKVHLTIYFQVHVELGFCEKLELSRAYTPCTLHEFDATVAVVAVLQIMT